MSGATSTTSRHSAPALDATLAVETPEQVTLTYTIAGFGSRALAALLDAAVIVAVSIALVFLSVILQAYGIFTARSHVRTGGSGAVVFAILVLAEFTLLWGYYVLFEGLNDGQTPGKRFFGLRVVRDGGFAMTFAASAVRNLARIVDAQPGLSYGVGAISILATKSGKRLGDLLAGTFVVHETKVKHFMDGVPSRSAGAESSIHPVTTVTPLLSDDEYDVLDRYMVRRNSLTQERRQELARQIADSLRRPIEASGASPSTSPTAALVTLFERERAARSSRVATHSDTGTRREQHAIVALGVGRWNDFSTRLADVQRTGLRRMSAEQVSDFVERYRQISTDLAQLQTASRGRTFDAMFFVSRLVAGGHAILYRERRDKLATAARYISGDLPREIRRSAGAIAIATLLFFLPAAISFGVVVAHPSVAPRFVSPVLMQRAEQGAARARRHEGYVTIPPEERPIAASFIISNNVQISYAAFALGLTAGLGTIVILILNGVALGGGVGIFTAKGVAPLLLAFVAPHGVLELSAICIAGGGGLLIASALILPGQVTRAEALVVRGRRAIRLVAASTLFLIVAGTIEGLVSPQVWPLQWKLVVSGLTAVAMVLYITLGRTSVSTEPDVRADVLRLQ